MLISRIKEWLLIKPKTAVDSNLSEIPAAPELFSADQMERYGISLALLHKLATNRVPNILLHRLSQSEETLIKSCEILTNRIKSHDSSLSPASEWLLDNFYLIQEQIQSIRHNLPKGYGKTLPQLAGNVPGFPRVYDIALQIVEHSDCRWGADDVSRFIAAYQEITPLTLGELWAIPITLGVALIDNLAKASKRIVADIKDRHQAEYWANQMIETAVNDPKKLVLVIADMARSEPPSTRVFLAELARRLRSATLLLPLTWVEQHLSEEGLTIDQLMQEESKDQAALQIMVSNAIASLRRLNTIVWSDFVEGVSLVHHTLATDPTGTYCQMDFRTRDCYRHVVERLSRMSQIPENDVAKMAINLARSRQNTIPVEDRNTADNLRYWHVGYYLIGSGYTQLRESLGVRHSLWKKIGCFAEKWAIVGYVGSIVLITTALTSFLLIKASSNGFTHWLWLLGIILAVCGSQLAVALVNWAVTILIKPQSRPRMDFSKGIPAEASTLVAVPAMLWNPQAIDSLVEALEVRFLGNRDEHIYFALLTDFNDAQHEHMPDDEVLLQLVAEKITTLNARYSPEDRDIFFLMHRPRQWNAGEQVWMGRERKRGKLNDLNNLLQENEDRHFSLIVGRTAILKDIKYVITLDSDTQLPRDTAHQLIGAMFHPLNRPLLDETKQRVIEGYGILQPRMAESLASGGQTRYVRLCGNEFGIDPYTHAVSDVYQDLFHEGSFIGKGIYDVGLFQRLLEKQLPDNAILSHDLLEGCYLRSSLLSDVPLYEETPSNYLADVKRRTRWIRGDWQLMRWLWPSVMDKAGNRIANTLSCLSKWKIFDNLRASIIPIALMGLLVFNWTILPATHFWLIIILGIVILPAVVSSLFELMHKSSDVLPSQHIHNMVHVIRRRVQQLILYIACLPHVAWYTLIAIVRTCWRILISKRHRLEWTPSDQVNSNVKDTFVGWFARMWMGPVASLIGIGILVYNGRMETLFFTSPLFILWFISPLWMRWLSRVPERIEPKLDPYQIRFLHRMSRITWRFFDTFMRAEDNWLPPDNFQEIPIAVVARRTSPTNIGLSLLANLTAYDFGYINIAQLLERTNNTLQSLAKLERYQSHLYNWYDTETLAPLYPRYISTVDNGNLAGHLLTLRQGLLELPDDALLSGRYLEGLQDTYDVLVKAIGKSIQDKLFNVKVNHFKQLLNEAPKSWIHWTSAITVCNELCKAAKQINMSAAKYKTAFNEIAEWSSQLMLQCCSLRDEIKLFACVPGVVETTTLRDIALLDASNPSEASLKATERLALIEALANHTFELAQMDMGFLYNEKSHLMTIGFNVEESRRDASDYDLLSSEARLGSFVAIALGQIPQENWFTLGRLLVSYGGEPILISWSGSMFEYLMPQLVMPSYPDTLLDQTSRAAIRGQIAYGKQCRLPWGVSESGYNAFDTQSNYLYRAFGVPGLGLKRGLEDDRVIAPYATALALMFAPKEACLNLQRLASEDAVGHFGFYEAIDFTPARLPPDRKRALICSYMAHHQGMSFLSFSYLLHNQPMQRRFKADPLFQATLLLLQERIPKPTASYVRIPKLQQPDIKALSRPAAQMRLFNTPHTNTPQVHLLSNGNYHTVITQAGGGYSRWKNIAITRWREDSTCDNWGLFGYVRDLTTGAFWSTGYQPTGGDAEHYRVVYSEGHAEFTRTDNQLQMHSEIGVSPEDDMELRRVRIHNRSKTRRVIEFTSYAEIVLAPQAADLAQPAFSNLFVETELLPEFQAILATRRPQDDKQNPPYMCHLLNVYTDKPYTISFETDRSLFIGRGRSVASPLAMVTQGELSNTVGSVLDPIVAIRCKVTLEPNTFMSLDLFTGMAENREQCIALVKKYNDRNFAHRIFRLAWTHSQILLHQFNISETDAQLFGKLASAIIYTSKTRRADASIIASNRRGQSSLWGYSISGDLPIVLLYIEDAVNFNIVQQLIQAQAYWRVKGLVVDLVILNEERVSYRQVLQDQILSFIAATSDHIGNIVVRVADQVPIEDRLLLQTVARVILSDKRGSLKEQLNRRSVQPPVMPELAVGKAKSKITPHLIEPFTSDSQFVNGLGGFNASGDEYIIRLREGKPTPAPWVNVLANPHFGTLVSESGQGYTWGENAHEFRLTPWENDPLQDASGEAYYLRDEETGHVWSPTPLPCRGRGDYQTRHGFGYSVFEHVEDDIHSEMWVYTALDASVKYVVLKIRNESMRHRQLSATGYVAWVLGDLRTKNAMHVVTELSPNGALLAKNYYNTEFPERTAFFDVASNLGLNGHTVTGDRTEFIGRNGSLKNPAALKRTRLSGRVGAGLDPCGAIQLAFDLPIGQSYELVFTLGVGRDARDADDLMQRYHGMLEAQDVLTAIRKYWKQKLSIVTVKTPDLALNIMANGWLIYQLLSSRLWGRSGYYQSGGAFGFRDQLQDVMALTHIAPELLRAHLLLCATHQFEEGDVQHWWHPPQNRGVRTRCSDDYLWLPFALCHYLETTGDTSILDEKTTFLQGRLLNEDEESYYELPMVGEEAVSIYQHAVRAITHGLRFGVHGLPLMGSGDWNDGMNFVGIEGKGESVWLGFFLYSVLKQFIPVATQYGDTAFAKRCHDEMVQLQEHIESNAWDGQWYRRAYFDDGTPLGSEDGTECKIDSIAQSWSVLSGAGSLQRTKQALASLYKHLVDSDGELIKLLAPPFDTSKPSPGYIQGYVPGIRENGGQYTHAAVWATMAFSKQGEHQLAWQLFRMLNPINHGNSPETIARYKIEPYVLAADIYGVDPHMGRGGWSWYTGAAGWLYRLITEILLGVQLENGNSLRLTPSLPDDWDTFSVDYKYNTAVYTITVTRAQSNSIEVDGKAVSGSVIGLLDDGQTHEVRVRLE